MRFFFKFTIRLIAVIAAGIIGILSSVPGAAAPAETPPPLAARMVLQKANLLMAKKKASKAVELLESFRSEGMRQVESGRPDRKGATHYLIDFHLGNACLMLEQFKDATAHYQSALKKNPGFSAGWLNLAKCNYDLKQHAEAARCFLKGYDTAETKQAEILYYSAVSFLTAGLAEKAVETFERLLSFHTPQIRLEWKETFVHACLACNQNRRALPYIEELAEKSAQKKKRQWQEVLLYQYVTLNMKTRALNYAHMLTHLHPLEPKWWKALVHIHLLDNHYRPALVSLTILGFLTPLSRDEKKLMADLNAALGIPLQAVRCYETLLEEKPDPEIIKRVVYACLNLREPEKALRFTERGLRIDPADVDFQMLKGRILYEMERFQDAALVFESAARKHPGDGELWMMLGYAAWNLQDTVKAEFAFQKALAFPKHRKKALKILASTDFMPRP